MTILEKNPFTVFTSPNKVDTVNIISLLYKKKSPQDQRMKANTNYDQQTIVI